MSESDIDHTHAKSVGGGGGRGAGGGLVMHVQHTGANCRAAAAGSCNCIACLFFCGNHHDALRIFVVPAVLWAQIAENPLREWARAAQWPAAAGAM